MQEILLAFYKANQPKAKIEDKIVSFFTRSIYSHTEIVYQGVMYSSSPRDNGVRSKPHNFDKEVWDYVPIKLPHLECGMEFFQQTQGLKYDLTGALGIFFKLGNREDRYFCTEWCGQFLIISGYSPLFTKNPALLTPKSLNQIVKGEL